MTPLTHENIQVLRGQIIDPETLTEIDKVADPRQYLALYKNLGIETLEELTDAMKDQAAWNALAELYLNHLGRETDPLCEFTDIPTIYKLGDEGVKRVARRLSKNPASRRRRALNQ